MKLEMYVLDGEAVVDRITLDEDPAGQDLNPNPMYETSVAEPYVSWVLGRQDLTGMAKRRKLAATTCVDGPDGDDVRGIRRVTEWTS